MLNSTSMCFVYISSTQHVGQPNVRKNSNGILQQHLHHPNTPRSMTQGFYFDRAKKLAGASSVADRLQQDKPTHLTVFKTEPRDSPDPMTVLAQISQKRYYPHYAHPYPSCPSLPQQVLSEFIDENGEELGGISDGQSISDDETQQAALDASFGSLEAAAANDGAAIRTFRTLVVDKPIYI